MAISPEPTESLASSDAAGEGSDILSTAAAGPAAARGGALRVGGYLIGALLGAAAAALLFRHLGPVETGRYAIALTLVAVISALSDLGLTAVGVREISALGEGERWQVARDLLGLRITLSVIGGTIVTLIALVAYSPNLAAGVALASVGLLLQAVQDNVGLPLVVGLRLGWVSAIELLRNATTALFTVLLVVLGARLVPFLAISIPVGMIALAVTVRVARAGRNLAPRFELARWRRFARGMLPYSVAVAASALYLRVSVLVVSALSDPHQVGYFGASFRVIEVLTLVPALAVGAAFPIFSRAAHGDHERLGYALGRVFEVALIAGAWVALSIAIAAPLIFRILGDHRFAPAAPVLAVQGVALGAMFVSQVWAYGLLSLGLFRRIMVLNVAALALNVALVSALVEIDGAHGAAIGTAVVEVVAAIAQCVAVTRGRPALKPSLRIVPCVAIASALGILPILFAGEGAVTIAALVLSSVLYAAALVLTRALPRELVELLPGRIGGLLERGVSGT